MQGEIVDPSPEPESRLPQGEPGRHGMHMAQTFGLSMLVVIRRTAPPSYDPNCTQGHPVFPSLFLQDACFVPSPQPVSAREGQMHLGPAPTTFYLLPLPERMCQYAR